MKKSWILAGLCLVILSSTLVFRQAKSQAVTDGGCVSSPCPPPPPKGGQLGGPLLGLTVAQATTFNNGYFEYNVKWDPSRGLGPVFTQTGCYNCHGGGGNSIADCINNPPGVACVAGGSSNILGTRYGKFNTDGSFNYLDGNGTFPENEGGPIMHGQGNAQFDTISGCSQLDIAASPTGATESGTTVTITTVSAHGFKVGQRPFVASVKNSGYNGTFTSILSVPSSTTFTYQDTTNGLKPSGGGVTNNNPHEVIPTDASTVGLVRSPELYGLGLIDSIPEATITAAAAAECANKGTTGICGVTNMVPDENGNLHVGRFGQKDNIVDLFQFTEEAFFNEMGITNKYNTVKHLPQGLPAPDVCSPDKNSPNDVNGGFLIPTYQFQELLAPATPLTGNSAGQTVFNNIGCNICHIATMTTGPNITLITDLNGGRSTTVNSLSNQVVTLYSDLLLHDMGTAESGGIPFQPSNQGQATLTQWRTAPLMGLHLRIPLGLMHGNGSKTVDAAILAHGGEAAKAVAAYQKLDSTDEANLLAFLGSL